MRVMSHPQLMRIARARPRKITLIRASRTFSRKREKGINIFIASLEIFAKRSKSIKDSCSAHNAKGFVLDAAKVATITIGDPSFSSYDQFSRTLPPLFRRLAVLFIKEGPTQFNFNLFYG